MNLLDLGLRPGDRIRFRRRPDQRWKQAAVSDLEADGSIRVIDADGASRSLPVDAIEVREAGPRGAVRWVPLKRRARSIEQLDLFRG